MLPPPPDSKRRIKRCIALIGPRGSGKSAVGAALANLVGGKHLDTDILVMEGCSRSIADIFASEGEPGFRRREVEAVTRACKGDPVVISVGGGAVLDPQNVEKLKEVATLILLTAPADELLRRIRGDAGSTTSRPPLTELGELDEIKQLLAQRTPIYQSVADWTIVTTDRTPENIAHEIARRMGFPV